MYKSLTVLVSLTVLTGPALGRDEYENWITHSSFEDFASGRIADGGTNLYIARSGQLEMTYRWDLNNDGFLDLLVIQDHNPLENVDALVYWGKKGGPESILPPLPDHQPLARLLRQIRIRDRGVTRLPSDGGGRSLVVDLNQDGYPELVFCNFIHNYSVHMMALIYWGSPDGYQRGHRTELPTLLAGGLAAGDFNGDGWIDLAFSNRGIEGGERFGFDLHLESYVYWNGPRGFRKEDRAVLATTSAADVAAADVNRDGYSDLLFANNNSKHQSLVLYRGGPEGIRTPGEQWQAGDAVGATLAEVSGDRNPDLILAHKDDRVTIHKGTGRGISREAWVEVPSLGAKDSRVGDLNRDGHPDLILPNERGETSYIYWGGQEGYSPGRRQELPTLTATDAVLADYNEDGWVDLAFSNNHDGATRDVASYLYWNGPDGFHAAYRRELQGFGAVSLAAGDMDLDGHQDLALINQNSGSHDPIDSVVYWGNPRHHYSPAAASIIPAKGGLATTADLDRDGWVDLIFPDGSIFGGGANGFRLAAKLEMEPSNGVTVGDLNRDGYLDLTYIVGGAHRELPPTARILWGGENGHDPSRRTDLKLGIRIGQAGRVADFNKDGALDLIFTDVDSGHVDLFWGNLASGYSQENQTVLKIQPTSSPEIADLNGDGWLDLIFGGGWDPTRFGRPTRQAILVWGGRDGFHSDRITELEAFDSLEQAVADLNRDGHLDIVMTNYHAYHTRTLPAFIYWGADGGSYSESRRTSLPAESSSALTVADMNQDSWLDLVVFNHLERGDHSVGSNIYWGAADGYSYDRRHWFQTFGPHFGRLRDVGNIYDRRLREEYVSAVLEAPAGKSPGRLRWKALTPHGTGVQFQVRSASSRTALESSPWRGPEGPASTFQESGAALQLPAGETWFQYRAILTTPDGGSTPVLQEVAIDVGR